MKRKPSRLNAVPVGQDSSLTPPACPLSTPTSAPPPPDPASLFPEPPPLEVIYAALDEIAEEWGIKL